MFETSSLLIRSAFVDCLFSGASKLYKKHGSVFHRQFLTANQGQTQWEFDDKQSWSHYTHW